MCNLQQWTLVDEAGVRHPQERLFPCNRTTPANAPCGHVEVYTMNDEVLTPHYRQSGQVNLNAALVNNPPQSAPLLKKAKRNDLRLEFGSYPSSSSKKKATTLPTPTALVTTAQQPGLIPLDKPLVANPAPPLMVQPPQAGPAIIPIAPRPQFQRPRRGERERIVMIEPGPAREHRHRRQPNNVPARRYSPRYRSTRREHEQRRHQSPARGRNNRPEGSQARTPSPVIRRRRSAEERAARINEGIIRLRGEIERRNVEREQARRTTAREEELRRLDRRIQDLHDEVNRRQRARRAERVVIHQDDYRDNGRDYDRDYRDRAPSYHARHRERSRSSSRERVVRFEELGDQGRRRQSYIEDRPRDEPYPFARGRGVSEIRRSWAPRRDREEHIMFDDERRGGRGRGGWL